MIDVANLLVGGGVSAVVVALIGAIFGRRLSQANYAEIVVKLSHSVAADLREDNRQLEAKVDRLGLELDGVLDQLATVSDQLRVAIPLLQAAGYDVTTMRAALYARRNGHP